MARFQPLVLEMPVSFPVEAISELTFLYGIMSPKASVV